jgi:hypothetical protein
MMHCSNWTDSKAGYCLGPDKKEQAFTRAACQPSHYGVAFMDLSTGRERSAFLTIIT